MKKNKRILLAIITILVSTMLFVNKTKAITMWMQCTDSPSGEMYHNNKLDEDAGNFWNLGKDANNDYKKYNTFARINNINPDTRYLIYVGNDFYKGVQAPIFAMYTDDNGKVSDQICWYNNEFFESEPKSGGPLHECDKEDDFISVSELDGGTCPNAIYQTKGTNTSGGVKGDFAVLQGTKKPSKHEELTESTLVIYGFQKSNGGNNVDLMIEGYNSAGLYGYATTWNDWDSFEKKLNLKKNDSDTDLINEDEYDDEFMSWTAMTQARRINKFGSDYFKLLDNKRPWIVGAVDNQEFKIIENKDGKSVMFRSDDSNNNFYNWVEEWYKEYDDELKEQISAKEKLDSNYKKTLDTAKEISDAVNNGKKYNFGSYTASQMVKDLNEASKLLDTILSEKGGIYDTYDDSCHLQSTKTDDALSSVITKFNCDIFGVSSISKLPHGANHQILNSILLSNLSAAINKHAGSNTSIESLRSEAEEMAKMFTIAIKYIEKNESVSGISSSELDDLVDKYTEMSRNIGVEVIIDCEDLIGDDLRNKIGEYLKIVKLIVPILLIVFGIIDFTKAMFAGDEEKMKKAQKDFATRIVIAIIFFFVPTIVDLILGLANKVWNFIEPGSCGIFNG